MTEVNIAAAPTLHLQDMTVQAPFAQLILSPGDLRPLGNLLEAINHS
jgi:hypothetical protein